MRMLTQSRLRELLHYDPETGFFTRALTTTGIRPKVGDVAGGVNCRGYWQIRIDGERYKAHRLAWLYMTGDWPKEQIDHINMDRSDNRFANLREATNIQNCANQRRPVNNTSGLKGVCWNKRLSKWKSQIRVNGKLHHLGYFDTAEAAHESYIDAAKKYFGEFARAA